MLVHVDLGHENIYLLVGILNKASYGFFFSALCRVSKQNYEEEVKLKIKEKERKRKEMKRTTVIIQEQEL